jgi:hypothetical protein
MQAVSTLCRGIPLNMVQNNSFSFTFHSTWWFKNISFSTTFKWTFFKEQIFEKENEDFFQIACLFGHNGTFNGGEKCSFIVFLRITPP